MQQRQPTNNQPARLLACSNGQLQLTKFLARDQIADRYTIGQGTHYLLIQPFYAALCRQAAYRAKFIFFDRKRLAGQP